MMDRRLVFVPHGLPSHPESRERCCELVLRCGGDLMRLFDGTDRRIEHFAQHIAGITDVVNAREVPLIVLTRVQPITELLRVRQVLEAEVAALERAPWLVYADPFQDDACLETLQRFGKLTDSPLDAPLWTGPDGLRYLILSPLMHKRAIRALPERLAGAESGSPGCSATRRLGISPTLEVPVSKRATVRVKRAKT
jgi:hypothetical protein